jgi:hypothetical protein
VDVSFIEAHLIGDRLTQFEELSQDAKEAAIITATQLVDISYEWKGTRKSLEQGLSWPRNGVKHDGFEITGIPAAVKKAVCEAVWLSMTEESLFSTENNKEVVRERVEGAVDVSYANPKDRINGSATRFEVLDKLLRGLYGKVESVGGGSSVGSARVERA